MPAKFLRTLRLLAGLFPFEKHYPAKDCQDSRSVNSQESAQLFITDGVHVRANYIGVES